jgi:hypothetical protein
MPGFIVHWNMDGKTHTMMVKAKDKEHAKKELKSNFPEAVDITVDPQYDKTRHRWYR